jgi:hypothetical protein
MTPVLAPLYEFHRSHAAEAGREELITEVHALGDSVKIGESKCI